MNKKNTLSSTPLTFDIEEDLLQKIKYQQKNLGAKNLSEVIRHAIRSYSFSKFKAKTRKHKQVSVRLPEDIKKNLYTFSDKKNVSIGELLRVAIEDLCVHTKPTKTKSSTSKSHTNRIKSTLQKSPSKSPSKKKK